MRTMHANRKAFHLTAAAVVTQQQDGGTLFTKELYPQKISLRRSLCVVFAVAFFCFINTWNAGFVYDDTRCIMKNQDLRPETSWENIFFNDFWGTPLSHSGSHKSYRPLCIYSFRLNYQYGGLNPRGYHLVNNILHSLVSCLFLCLCHVVYKDMELSLFGGVLFAVHPIHTEAVAGIVGRADVGAAMFFIISMIFYHSAVNNDLRKTSHAKFLLCIVCAFCSTFTKEQGVTVLGVLAAYEMLFVSKCNLSRPVHTFKKLKETGGASRIVALIISTFTILNIRFLIMGNSLPDFAPADNPAASEPVFLTRLLTFLYLPVCNLWLLICPSNLSYDYSMYTIPLVEEIFRFENILSVSLYASLCSIVVLYLKYCSNLPEEDNESPKNRHQQNARYQFNRNNNNNVNKTLPVKSEEENNFMRETMDSLILGLAVLILPYLPATNLFFYVGFIVAERILYIPSIGFCLLVVNGVRVLLNKYPDKRSQLQKILMVILVLFAAKTVDRNQVWKNEESLYRSGLKTSPAKSYSNLANVLVKQGRNFEGEMAYKRALKYRYNMADTHYNLGILMQNSKRHSEAIKSYRDAIKYRPRLAAAHLNLGVTLMTMKRLDEAYQVLHNASEISDHGLKDPQQHATSLTHIRYNKGKVLYDLRKYKEALSVFLDALQRMPDNYERHSLYNMIGQCYTGLENYEYAQPWYHRASHEKPDHVPALLTLAKHYIEHSIDVNLEWERIDGFLRQAMSFEPENIDVYLVYGNYLEKRGDSHTGVQIMEKALKVQPNNAQILSLLSSFHRNRSENDEALKYLIKASKLKPANSNLLMNLGAMYHLLGDLKEAELTYQQALKYQPNNRILMGNIEKLKKQQLNEEQKPIPETDAAIERLKEQQLKEEQKPIPETDAAIERLKEQELNEEQKPIPETDAAIERLKEQELNEEQKPIPETDAIERLKKQELNEEQKPIPETDAIERVNNEEIEEDLTKEEQENL